MHDAGTEDVVNHERDGLTKTVCLAVERDDTEYIYCQLTLHDQAKLQKLHSLADGRSGGSTDRVTWEGLIRPRRALGRDEWPMQQDQSCIKLTMQSQYMWRRYSLAR